MPRTILLESVRFSPKAALYGQPVTLMRHLFRYLKGTAAYGIELGGKNITIDDLRMLTSIDALCYISLHSGAR